MGAKRPVSIDLMKQQEKHQKNMKINNLMNLIVSNVWKFGSCMSLFTLHYLDLNCGMFVHNIHSGPKKHIWTIKTFHTMKFIRFQNREK